MNNQFGLSGADISSINKVFERFPVAKVVIYGSRAISNYRHASDIDLTVMNLMDRDVFTRLKGELDDLLLPYKVDLLLYPQIDNPDLIEHIQRVGKVLFCK